MIIKKHPSVMMMLFSVCFLVEDPILDPLPFLINNQNKINKS